MPAAGWYPDPEGAAEQRWWDGTAWSERTRETTMHPPRATAAAQAPSGWQALPWIVRWAIVWVSFVTLLTPLAIIIGIVLLLVGLSNGEFD